MYSKYRSSPTFNILAFTSTTLSSDVTVFSSSITAKLVAIVSIYYYRQP